LVSRLVGVLALQGDFREHRHALEELGCDVREVRTTADLEGLTAIVIPGGESLVIGRLSHLFGLLEPLADLIRSGLPTLGTCAGMIYLARGVTEGTQYQLGVLDVVIERNAWGRQNDSFEMDIYIDGLEEPHHGVFIRGPWVEELGDDIEVLSRRDGHPVMIKQGNILATSFHPELTNDRRLHKMLLEIEES
jgi:5'-phosphate synthase pdxT subunit